MDDIKKFVDLFVSNFQPEPQIEDNQVIWQNRDGWVRIKFLEDITYYATPDYIKSFRFDGTPESIPEELMDEIFRINGFGGEEK